MLRPTAKNETKKEQTIKGVSRCLLRRALCNILRFRGDIIWLVRSINLLYPFVCVDAYNSDSTYFESRMKRGFNRFEGQGFRLQVSTATCRVFSVCGRRWSRLGVVASVQCPLCRILSDRDDLEGVARFETSLPEPRPKFQENTLRASSSPMVTN